MQRAIVNSSVFDVETGTFKENTTVLWKNGVIKEVGRQVELPSDVEIIEGKGCYVTPGLINGFTHLGLKEYGVRWEGNDAFEASDTSQPNLSAIDGIYPFDKGFEVARAAGVTTANVSPGPENIISGMTTVIKTNGTVIDEMVVKDKHGLSVSLGEIPKSINVERRNQPLTRMGIASFIREQLRKVLYNSGLDNTVDNIFIKILKKNIPMYVQVHRADDIETAVRLKEEFDINIILVHATEAYQLINMLAKSKIPVIAGPFFTPKMRYEIKNLHPSTTVALRKAGIPTAIATSTTRNLSLEGALAVREGLTMGEALCALTIDTARMLGISKQLGSIEIGKQADLVLWNGEPLELMTTVRETIIDGTTVYKREDMSE